MFKSNIYNKKHGKPTKAGHQGIPKPHHVIRSDQAWKTPNNTAAAGQNSKSKKGLGEDFKSKGTKTYRAVHQTPRKKGIQPVPGHMSPEVSQAQERP